MSPVVSTVAIPLSPLQFAILGVYLALLVGIAAAFRKFNRDGDDYFRSGCQGSWWLVGMSTYMASFSAFTFTGLAGAAYRAGFSATSNFIANILGFAVNGLFLAAWLRQLRVTTAPEVIRDRFGPRTEQLYGWTGNLLGILYSALTLYTLCIFAATVFGLPILGTIVVVGLVVTAYSMIGGRWAVMGADFIQGMILIPITVLLAILCLRAVGGPLGFLEAISERNLWDDFRFFKEPRADLNYNFTAPWVMASTMALLMDRISLTAAPRYFSCRDGREASRAGWFVAALMLASTLVFFAPPMTARMLFPEAVASMPVAQPAETAYAVASLQFLPEPLMGLMVVAIFSATLSTMDAGLNMFAAVFVRNIYPALGRRLGWTVATGSRLVRLGELTTLLSGLIIIGIACAFAQARGHGAFEIMLDLGALLSIPMAVPMVLGLVARSAPRRAAAWSILAGLTVSCSSYLATRLPFLGDLIGRWTYDEKVFATIAAGAAAFFLAGWRAAEPAEARARTDEFYRRMHTPVDFSREVGVRSSERGQSLILGRFCLVAAAAVLLLAAVAGPWRLAGSAGVVVIAGFQAAVGVLLLTRARRRAPPS